MTAEGRASPLSQAQLEVLAAMLRLHPGLAFLATSDGCVLAANEAAVRHWSDAVAAGGRASLLFPEDTRETFGALESAVLTKGEPATFSWGQQGPAGIRSWFTSSVSPLGAGAQVIGLPVHLVGRHRAQEVGAAVPAERGAVGGHAGRRAPRHLGVGRDRANRRLVGRALSHLWAAGSGAMRRVVRGRRADFAPRQNGIITFCPWRRSSLWTTTRRS